MRFLVTGGAGFIGSAVARHVLTSSDDEVLVVDKLTYAGNLEALSSVISNPRFNFCCADIADGAAMKTVFESYLPDTVMNLAAESHVDRSIDGPQAFIQTNIVGTFTLLNVALSYWRSLSTQRRNVFRFHHISTDEVFGSLGDDGFFNEASAYSPNSPYAATKAASDHLVQAWSHTYGLPILLSNCSNNYGPFQFPEKLIPRTIIHALHGKPVDIYGDGSNMRDWLHVDDHVEALLLVARNAVPGSRYVVGGNAERTNLEVVDLVFRILDDIVPDVGSAGRRSLIRYVSDRPGHDYRYAINAGRIFKELGWKPRHSFEAGLHATVQWYVDNRQWWQHIMADSSYRDERLGNGGTPGLL